MKAANDDFPHTMSSAICPRCRIRYLPLRGVCRCIAIDQENARRAAALEEAT